VRAKVQLGQAVEADHLGIKVDFDRLAVIADLTIRGIRLLASAIANAGSQDARETPEPGVGSPESAHGKGGGLELLWRGGVDRGDLCGLQLIGREQHRQGQDHDEMRQAMHRAHSVSKTGIVTRPERG